MLFLTWPTSQVPGTRQKVVVRSRLAAAVCGIQIACEVQRVGKIGPWRDWWWAIWEMQYRDIPWRIYRRVVQFGPDYRHPQYAAHHGEFVAGEKICNRIPQMLPEGSRVVHFLGMTAVLVAPRY